MCDAESRGADARDAYCMSRCGHHSHGPRRRRVVKLYDVRERTVGESICTYGSFNMCLRRKHTRPVSVWTLHANPNDGARRRSFSTPTPAPVQGCGVHVYALASSFPSVLSRSLRFFISVSLQARGGLTAVWPLPPRAVASASTVGFKFRPVAVCGALCEDIYSICQSPGSRLSALLGDVTF